MRVDFLLCDDIMTFEVVDINYIQFTYSNSLHTVTVYIQYG